MHLDAPAQVVRLVVDQTGTSLPWAMLRHRGSLREARAHRLAVKPGAAGDLRDAQPLSPKVVNHEYLRAGDHQWPLLAKGGIQAQFPGRG